VSIVCIRIFSIKKEGGTVDKGVGMVTRRGEGDVERETVRRVWLAKVRRETEKCWIWGRRSWLAKTYSITLAPLL